MKVLMICTEKLPVPPVLGGAIQTYISGNIPYLSKIHDITILGISDPTLPDQETIDGVRYIRVPGKILEIYREGVVRYVESHQFDLIHIFNRPRLVIPVRTAAPQAKITLSMHNDMFNTDKIDSDEANTVLEEVSGIVTVSNYVGNVIRNLYPQAASKIRTIYSGVDSERFLPGKHPKMQKIRNEIRSSHGLENKTVILYAGRLSHNKGVDKLVRALPELSKKFKDLALVIVGSKWFSQDEVTDFIAYVKSLAKKLPIPVVATGFVAPDEIQNWFAAADLFVCTSQWQEPLARVHYEAMAAGLPIVTTARGGNPEVIMTNENGLIVDRPEDPDCFVEKISELLSNKSLMKRMGETGRKLAISRYSWDRVASEIMDVWEQAKQMVIAPVAKADLNETTEVFNKNESEDGSATNLDYELDYQLYNDLEYQTNDESEYLPNNDLEYQTNDESEYQFNNESNDDSATNLDYELDYQLYNDLEYQTNDESEYLPHNELEYQTNDESEYQFNNESNDDSATNLDYELDYQLYNDLEYQTNDESEYLSNNELEYQTNAESEYQLNNESLNESVIRPIHKPNSRKLKKTHLISLFREMTMLNINLYREAINPIKETSSSEPIKDSVKERGTKSVKKSTRHSRSKSKKVTTREPIKRMLREALRESIRESIRM
ncbi:glycosyltransferase family 4 protein [Bacillus sp. CECT 9360]|uniref:glycosyltransferase family 4 protein n=1 Tax=Bacillus sp. CECT 9360 TaxID=2845821 RepID=UPI001EF9C291|nr:D-inositol-3-phosphate glycosyltransferase [Bacillus sp. CECT 9360]